MSDVVNQPPHYKQGKVETIDLITTVLHVYAYPIDGFLIGNVVKYISRAPFKGNYLQDLKKAQWYLNRCMSQNRHYGPYNHTDSSYAAFEQAIEHLPQELFGILLNIYVRNLTTAKRWLDKVISTNEKV